MNPRKDSGWPVTLPAQTKLQKALCTSKYDAPWNLRGTELVSVESGTVDVRTIIEPLHRAKFWMQLLGVVMILYGVLIALSIVGLIVAWIPIWAGWGTSRRRALRLLFGSLLPYSRARQAPSARRQRQRS